MIRIGLVGLGGMGQIHLGNFLRQPDAHVVALADTDEKRRSGQLDGVAVNLEQRADAVSAGPAKAYADYRKLCQDRNVDAVVISLPTDLHADATVRALEAGKHVLCEKPMARTVAEARRMLEAAEKSDRVLMIGHCLRFWPEFTALGDLIRGGRYGKVRAASFTRCCYQPPWGAEDWFGKPQRSGGAVFDLHIHDADVAVWYWGRPAKISADGAYSGTLPSNLHGQWRYNDGLVVQFRAGWDPVTHAPFYYGFHVTFERGAIVFDSRNDKGLQLATPDGLQTVTVKPASAYELEDRAFLDRIAGGRTPDICPPQDSLIALECVVEAAGQIADACGRSPDAG
jgi:predicted dehydrogenase